MFLPDDYSERAECYDNKIKKKNNLINFTEYKKKKKKEKK